MKSLWKYLIIICIFIVLAFLFLVNFWITDYEPPTSFGDDPEYRDMVINESIGYRIISLRCSPAYFPTLIVEDEYVIYVEQSIYKQPGIKTQPEPKGIVYLKNEKFELLLSKFDYLVNCGFGFSAEDFRAQFVELLYELDMVTGSRNSDSLLKNIYYCTDKWESEIYGNPDFQYRQLYYGTDKFIFRCEI